MPYSSIAEAEKENPGIRNLPAKAKRAWVAAFNSAKSQGHDDETAAKIAWSVASKIRAKLEKVMDTFATKIEVKGDELAIGIPFEKIDVKNRTIEGFATLDNVDSTGEIVDFEASRQAFRDWIGNIREMHGPKAVGKALQVEEREKEHDGKTYRGMYVKAYISKGAQDTWEKILDGTLRGFSLGGRVLEKRPEIIKSDDDLYSRRQVTRITKYTLGELSVVDNPANPLALIEGAPRGVLVKFSDGSLLATDVLGVSEERHVYYCEACDVAKVVGTDAEEVGCPTCPEPMTHIATSYERIGEEEVRKMVADHKEMLRKLQEEEDEEAGKRDPEEVNYRVADAGYSCAGCVFYQQNLGKCEKVKYDISANYVCDLFEERIDNPDLEVTEVYNNVSQVKKSADEEVNMETLEKREFSDKERQRLAREGLALPDGSFPIVTVEDLKNAIKAHGRAKDKEKVKRWIVRRARELGRTDLIPDEWKDEMNKSDDLQVNTQDDTRLSSIVDELVSLISEKMSKSETDIKKQEDTTRDGLGRILDVLKSALQNVEEILSKAGVVRLNSEDDEQVDHVEDVDLPSPADDPGPGKVSTDGTGADQELWADAPGSDNVLPHAMSKSVDEDDLIKRVITEEISKLANKLDSAFEAVEKRFGEFAERIERLENSGATKKSGEINDSEELKKSKDSFWGGKFFSGDF
jgi:Zn finger protein HypA/HybF involved in hydrogenase expression/cation transport regulator ChaB